MLDLRGTSKIVAGKIHLHPTELTFEQGVMNVLLGPTSAGKTSLMRLMAGLDRPDTGSILWQGQDVTGQRVQDRKVAIVYQQFINDPSMTVYDTIAPPLRLSGADRKDIDRRIRDTVAMLKLTPCWTGCRWICPGGNNSAVRWRAHWSRTPVWCCWTNRWRTWITSCARNCATKSPGYSAIPARSLSTPPPNPKRRCCWVAIQPPSGKAA